MQIHANQAAAKIKRLRLFLALAVIIWLGPITVGQQADLKNRYDSIEVLPFDVKSGIDFPDEYMQLMMADIFKDLHGLNTFKRVIAGPEPQVEGGGQTIQLVGTLIKYKHGSRSKRYFGLGLAGDTKIVGHVKFLDKVTGKLLLEADVDGLIHHGFLGGSSKGATSGIGKDVAKIVQKVFF